MLTCGTTKETVEWYHEMLCHPGETRIEHTLRQHFEWKGLCTTVHDVCKKLPTCKKAKSTYHTILQAYPMQLVFGQYTILKIKHVADWEHTRQHKQLKINHDNKRKNMLRNDHQYKVGDKILVKRKKNSKHKLEFMGPFPITQINDKDTVCLQKGIINDATNIHRIKPFFD